MWDAPEAPYGLERWAPSLASSSVGVAEPGEWPHTPWVTPQRFLKEKQDDECLGKDSEIEKA
jgi:hypothetical protein